VEKLVPTPLLYVLESCGATLLFQANVQKVKSQPYKTNGKSIIVLTPAALQNIDTTI